MKRIPKSFFRDYLLMSIAFVLLGTVFLVFPRASVKIICDIFGAFLCLIGLIRVIDYFITQVSLNEYRLGLVIGLIAIGAGVFIFIRPELLAGVLPTVFGVVVLLDSLVKLQNTLDMARLHDRKWLLTLIMTLVTAALGVVLLLEPFKASEAVILCLGISLILNGAMDTAALLVLYGLMMKTRNAVTESKAEEDEFD